MPKRIKLSIFGFYHEVLDLQIFTPVFYSIVLLIQFLQFIYLVMHNVGVRTPRNLARTNVFHLVLRYVAVFPLIVDHDHPKILMGVFLMFFSMLLLMFLIMTIYFWIGEHHQKDEKLGTKHQLNSSFKIVIKFVSLISILISELTIVPNLPLIYSLLRCKEKGEFNHLADMPCWSSEHSLLFIMAITHLILRLIF